ncbi:MAG: asparagine synthase [Caulobacteraceae bacterium]
MSRKVKEGLVPTILGTAVTAAGLAAFGSYPITAAGITGFGLAHIVLGGIDLATHRKGR